jgi:hypothetical protein
MKSGTGDVWGDDEDADSETVDDTDETADSETVGDTDETAEVVGEIDDSDAVGDDEDAVGSDRDFSGATESGGSRERSVSTDDAAAGPTEEKDIADNDISGGGGPVDASARADNGGDEQPYVVRRMLKDRSVQFERDERLTLFVHDDVKAGEQELEAETQELFGRDIPVFDIREAVYRAALRNRDDVVDELEEMGYERE